MVTQMLITSAWPSTLLNFDCTGEHPCQTYASCCVSHRDVIDLKALLGRKQGEEFDPAGCLGLWARLLWLLLFLRCLAGSCSVLCVAQDAFLLVLLLLLLLLLLLVLLVPALSMLQDEVQGWHVMLQQASGSRYQGAELDGNCMRGPPILKLLGHLHMFSRIEVTQEPEPVTTVPACKHDVLM